MYTHYSPTVENNYCVTRKSTDESRNLQNSIQKTLKRDQLSMTFPCVFRFLSCVFRFLSSKKRNHQFFNLPIHEFKVL